MDSRGIFSFFFLALAVNVKLGNKEGSCHGTVLSLQPDQHFTCPAGKLGGLKAGSSPAFYRLMVFSSLTKIDRLRVSQQYTQDQICVHITCAAQGTLVNLSCKGAGVFFEEGSAVWREGRRQYSPSDLWFYPDTCIFPLFLEFALFWKDPPEVTMKQKCTFQQSSLRVWDVKKYVEIKNKLKKIKTS